MLVKLGSASSDRLTFADEPRILKLTHLLSEFRIEMLPVDHFQKRSLGIDARDDDLALNLFARGEHDAVSAAVFDQHLVDRRLGSDLRAMMARRLGDDSADRAHAATGETPGAKRAVELAHVMMQQHIGGSRRARSHESADDTARRHGRFEHVGLEPFVEKIRRAHGHELGQIVKKLLAQAAKMIADPGKPKKIFGIPRGRLRRNHAEQGLYRHRHLHHQLAVLLVGFGVGEPNGARSRGACAHDRRSETDNRRPASA